MQEKQDINVNADVAEMPDDDNAIKRVGNKGRDNRRPEPAVTEAGASGKTKAAFMYLGPNIPGGRLFNGALFRYEIPEHLNGLFEKVGEIKELFVEVKEVPQAKRDVATAGTEFNRLFRTVQSEVMRGGLNDGV